MKIGIIHSIYKPFTRGGAEVVVEAIATEFQKQGLDIFIITLTNEEEGMEELDGIRVYRIKPWNIFSFLNIEDKPWLLRFFWHIFDTFNFSGARKVKNILKNENPDRVYTHNLKGLGYLIPRAIKKLGITHIHTVHDVQLVTPTGLLLSGKEKRISLYIFYARIAKLLYGSPDIVISPSKWLMEFYTTRGFFPRSKKRIISNPAQINKREIESFDHAPVTRFVYIGQLEPHKGIELLIKAFTHTIKSQPAIELWVVGKGSLLEGIKRTYAPDSSIKVLGYIPNSEHPEKVFAHIDYLVVPSLCYENSPAVIYESFANRKPVIAAQIGGIAELVQDGITGHIFKAGDAKELEQALIKGIHRNEHSKKMGEHARMEVSKYAIDNYCKKVLGL